MADDTQNPALEQAEEAEKEWLADHVLKPTTLSGIALNEYVEELWKDVDYQALANELQSLTEPLKENNIDHLEAILMGQAKVLDAMWSKLARLARNGAFDGGFSFKHFEAALKAQRRCCATLEALAHMKKTNSFSIIQQQNTTNLQVNTGITPAYRRVYRADGKNPCRHVEKFKEVSRERFLSESEVYALAIALKKYESENKYLKEQPHKKDKNGEQEENYVTPYITAAIRLLLLTGARCNEILTLKWQDVDFERKLIRLQESKTGQKTIYLSAPALKILTDMPRIEGNPYVICGRNEGSHLVNIKDPWGVIRGNAGLSEVRIHDLRHNYASTAVTSGHHLKVIGTLLGHANTKTTEKYAHLANDPLQTANEAISNRILHAMTTKPGKDNVVTIAKKQR
ncbi:MAG: site-specific integrase [Proteobacteria bacterium]|nr:site-specific integrase [Pseudomonadota bacterium]